MRPLNRHHGYSQSMGTRNYSPGCGLATTNRRTCKTCKGHKPTKGGSIRSDGGGFVCAECKAGVIHHG